MEEFLLQNTININKPLNKKLYPSLSNKLIFSSFEKVKELIIEILNQTI